MKISTTIFFLIFITPFAVVNAQPTEAGLPYIRNYSSKEYGAHTQNWAIVQDDRGVMYFGNTAGILEYDGDSWRLIPLLGASRIVFSLAFDSAGTLFVGSYNELGYLAANAVGQLQYFSLVEHLPEKYRQFNNVWRTFAADSAVYFTTPKFILRWQDGQFKICQAETRFFLSYYVRGHLYIRQKDIGLMVMQGDTLATIPYSEQIVQDGLTALLPFDDAQLLVATSKRLFLFDGNRFEAFSLRPQNLAEDVSFYVAAKIGADVFALATRNSGIIIFNKKGELLTQLDKSIGMQDESVSYVFEDREGALWVAFNNGISRVDIASQASYFDDRRGLKGKVQQCLRHNGALYIATTTGLYAIMRQGEASAGLPNMASPIPEISGDCWDLLALGSTLLVANKRGIYALDRSESGKQQATFISDYGAYAFLRSRRDSNHVLLALSDGLASIYRDVAQENGVLRWGDSGRVAGINERIRWLAQGRDNEFWLATSFKGIIRVAFDSSGSFHNQTIAHFDTADGLPSMRGIRVFSTDEGLYFGTPQGVYIFDTAEQIFLPAPGFDASIFREREVYRIVSVPGSRNLRMVLFGNGYEAGLARATLDGSYDWFSAPFLQFADLQINEIYPEPDGVVWLGTSEGLIRHDTNIDKNYELNYSALIRRITIQGDSVIFGGVPARNNEQNHSMPVLEHGNNALRFEYSAAYFDGNATNWFQYFLQGFDPVWSDWTVENKKDYTNLPEGVYRFRVRAKNVYGCLSAEDGFTFEILPPWYRTAWAYLAYAILMIGLFIGGVRWRSAHLVKEKEALEKIVSERTEEVQAQAEKLKEMDRLKSRFFANISHEFRTPLTLIINPLKELAKGKFKGDVTLQYGVMHRNARRLLRLINQLLDLAKLEAHGMILQASQDSVVAFLRGIVNAFASLAETRGIALRFRAEEEEIELYFDRDKLEKILNNLLSNAIKFTPEGGSVIVTVARDAGGRRPERVPDTRNRESDTGHQASDIRYRASVGNQTKSFVEIRVKDTGIGIPEDRLSHIFDRFYQVDSSHTREHEGTGIGLALTKELVALHQGEIHVTSREGEGTEFVILLPLGKEHLQKEEVVSKKDFPDFENLEDLAADEIVEPPAQPSEGSKPSEGSQERTVILIVEDNADVRNYIRQHLEATYAIAEARDGVQGVELALKTIPDLIISDVMMPNLDGYELCSRLKQEIKTSHIPIILLTAKAEDQDKIAGLETGADDYLIKPFNSAELLARVKNLIEQRRKLQEKYRRDFLLQPGEVQAVSSEEEFLQRACTMVEEHLSDPDFHVEQLASHLHLSRVSLHRKLRALVDQSTSEFIRSLRLKHGAQLLIQRTGNITEIAFQVGFSSSAYFTQCFHEQFGCSPSEYKKRA